MPGYLTFTIFGYPLTIIALVKEIISDEKNHLNLLQGIMLKHDNIDIAGDNMAETFAFLKKHAK